MRKILFIVVLLLSISNLVFSQEKVSKGKISGYMFGDYYYNLMRDTGIASMPNVINGGARDLNGIQLRRIYFTYDYDISEKFTTRFRVEADQVANTSDGKIGVFVKDAYLNWKNIFKGSDLVFGIQPTPAFEVSEGIWGNRFLEKTIMDLRGIVSSRDLAVSLKGNFDKDGMFKYWMMIGDGTGNRPEVDKYKRYYAQVQVSPVKNLTMTLYGDYKSKANINDPKSTIIPKATVSNNDLTYAFFTGYKEKDKYTFGAEVYMNSTQNGMYDSLGFRNRNGLGFSVFASYNFLPNLSVAGMFDYFDPNTDANVKGDSRNFFLLGLNYKPDEKVTISPNVEIETYEAVPNGREFKSSVTPRITLFYTFL